MDETPWRIPHSRAQPFPSLEAAQGKGTDSHAAVHGGGNGFAQIAVPFLRVLGHVPEETKRLPVRQRVLHDDPLLREFRVPDLLRTGAGPLLP